MFAIIKNKNHKSVMSIFKQRKHFQTVFSELFTIFDEENLLTRTFGL
jgi:hypothetical protein